MKNQRKSDYFVKSLSQNDDTELNDFAQSRLGINKKRFFRKWRIRNAPNNRVGKHEVVQDDIRLRRIKDRVEGIKFALGYDDMPLRQRLEMEKTLYNLKLAAIGIARQLKK